MVLSGAVDGVATGPNALTSDRDRLRRIGRKVRGRLDRDKAVRRIAVDKVEMWAAAGFFDPLECGRLIALIDAVAQPSKAYQVDYSTGYRTSYSGNLDPFHPLVQQLQRRLDTLLGIDPAHGETLQGQRYTAGQEFRPHTDWFPSNSPAWSAEQARGGQRSFTAMAYLNDVDDGGETDFPRLDIAVTPRAGTLLIWNNADEQGIPNPWTLHAGNPVVRGTKYVVTKWYRCGRWF